MEELTTKLDVLVHEYKAGSINGAKAMAELKEILEDYLSGTPKSDSELNKKLLKEKYSEIFKKVETLNLINKKISDLSFENNSLRIDLNMA